MGYDNDYWFPVLMRKWDIRGEVVEVNVMGFFDYKVWLSYLDNAFPTHGYFFRFHFFSAGWSCVDVDLGDLLVLFALGLFVDSDVSFRGLFNLYFGTGFVDKAKRVVIFSPCKPDSSSLSLGCSFELWKVPYVSK